MFYEKNPDENFLIEYQKIFNIKIYESFTKDSYDFLINQGYKSKNLFSKCYCPSGILEVIRNTDPKTFESVLGIEKENLE